MEHPRKELLLIRHFKMYSLVIDPRLLVLYVYIFKRKDVMKFSDNTSYCNYISTYTIIVEFYV